VRLEARAGWTRAGVGATVRSALSSSRRRLWWAASAAVTSAWYARTSAARAAGRATRRCAPRDFNRRCRGRGTSGAGRGRAPSAGRAHRAPHKARSTCRSARPCRWSTRTWPNAGRTQASSRYRGPVGCHSCREVGIQAFSIGIYRRTRRPGERRARTLKRASASLAGTSRFLRTK
jgi:hypothetical protein